MDNDSKEMLETILAKGKDALSQDEWAFLMARRSYLNDADTARYSEEIKLHEKGKFFKKEGADELDAMDLKALKALVAEEKLDIKVADFKKADDLREAIREARDAE